MQVVERGQALSGKFRGLMVVVDSIDTDGTMIVCRGGEWDVVGDTEIIPENTEEKK